MLYNSTDDLYETINPSTFGTHYIIIEADDGSVSWSSNDCVLTKIGIGRWILFCDNGTENVKRAQIHKSLTFK